MVEKLMNVVREEEGQGMAEYGLIITGVAVVAAGAFVILGGKIKTLIEGILTAPTP